MTDIILDTDLGEDIDDTWALGMLLLSKSLNLRYICVSTGNVVLKSYIIAKFLSDCGRTDIPIGIGVQTSEEIPPQYAAAADFDLSAYDGRIDDDGIGESLRIIRESDTPITVLAIAPATNIAALLARDPTVAQKIHVIGMQGSIYCGYTTPNEPVDEWNVYLDIPASQKMFSMCSLEITPLDSCGDIRLTGARYQLIANSSNIITRAVIKNYKIWCEASPRNETDVPKESSILFDTVAVYMAELADLSKERDGTPPQENLIFKRLPLLVDDEGFTRIHASGNNVDVALGWHDKTKFLDYLVSVFA